ncbi:MAG: hypothetical protein K2N09_02445 [Muribaculaceae bacterium]|nr:hypothetical protein [Muribaculaceae bacterium]
MKILCLIFSMLSWVYAFAGQMEYSVTFNCEEIVFSPYISDTGKEYTVCKHPEMHLRNTEGVPQLPAKLICVAVPCNAADIQVACGQVGSPQQFVLDNFIIPGQKPASYNDDVEFMEADTTMYIQNRIIPTAHIIDDYNIGPDTRILSVLVSPIEYDAKEHNLTFYDEMTIDIIYANSASNQSRSQGTSSVSNSQPTFYSSINDITSLIHRPSKYIIISTRELLPGFQELALWKRQKGYDVKCVSVEDILSKAEYSIGSSEYVIDAASAVRKYLIDEYQTSNGIFCLFGGGENEGTPIRRIKVFDPRECDDEFDLDHQDIHSINYIPTDAYFSDLTSDWPLDQDPDGGYSCYLSAVNYNPTIFVGRLLCHDVSEAVEYSNKLISYEIGDFATDDDFFNKSLYVVQEDMLDTYDLCSDRLIELSDNKILRDEVSDDTDINNHSITGAEVIREMSKCGYLSLYGHGTPAMIMVTSTPLYAQNCNTVTALDEYTGDILEETIEEDKNGLDNLTNGGKPGVFFSIACTTAPFDTFIEWRRDNYYDNNGVQHYGWVKRVFDMPYNIGQSYTLGKNYGGVAFIGNTRYSYMGYSDQIEVNFGQYISQFSKIGISLALARKGVVLEETSDDQLYNKRSIYSQNLIGDPEFEVWLATPLEQAIRLNGKGRNGNLEIIDPANAYISVDNGESCEHFPAKTNRIFLSNYISPKRLNDLNLVSVWKPGYSPFMKFLMQEETVISSLKQYSVREVELPYEGNKMSIAPSGDLRISSYSDLLSSCEVINQGQVNFSCENELRLENYSAVVNSCNNFSGKTVVFERDVTFEAGASLSVMVQ